MSKGSGRNGNRREGRGPKGSDLSTLLKEIDFGRHQLGPNGTPGGLFDLVGSEDGGSRCYGCTLCEKRCPVDCIEIDYRAEFPEQQFDDEAARTALSTTEPQPQIDMKLFDPVIEKIRTGSGLIEALHATQEAYGYLPRLALENIADEMHAPFSRIYGVATFYGQFRLKPVGKYVLEVCTGTACHVAGALLVAEAFSRELEIPTGSMTSDGLFTLQTVNCVGACALAPVVRIGNDQTLGRMGPNEARRLVQKLRKKEMAS